MLLKIIYFIIRDTISAVFQSIKNSDKKFCRPDIIFCTKHEDSSVVEVGNAEIKPKKAAKNLLTRIVLKYLKLRKDNYIFAQKQHARQKSCIHLVYKYMVINCIIYNMIILFTLLFRRKYCTIHCLFQKRALNSVPLIDEV